LKTSSTLLTNPLVHVIIDVFLGTAENANQGRFAQNDEIFLYKNFQGISLSNAQTATKFNGQNNAT
jgi:hypothetical protein